MDHLYIIKMIIVYIYYNITGVSGCPTKLMWRRSGTQYGLHPVPFKWQWLLCHWFVSAGSSLKSPVLFYSLQLSHSAGELEFNMSAKRSIVQLFLKMPVDGANRSFLCKSRGETYSQVCAAISGIPFYKINGRKEKKRRDLKCIWPLKTLWSRVARWEFFVANQRMQLKDFKQLIIPGKM